MSIERVVLWERLDAPGMDACRFQSLPDGWLIGGRAIFLDDAGVASLTYEVRCRSDWSTRTASIRGWIGARDFSLFVERSDASGWQADGIPVEGMSTLKDIDLGFTPATNTGAVRSLGLRPGEESETTALWLDTADWTLKPLPQVYRCVSETVFVYESPRHGYRAEITVDAFGVVTDYPGLWTLAGLTRGGGSGA